MNPNEFLYRLDNPQVYTGLEINVVKKEFNQNSINICLVFPDTYAIGMSHQGIKILYHRLNNLINVNAERCFLPERNSIDLFKKYHQPLFSIENKVPLKEFDMIGFSILSELNYTNVLQVLDLVQIPLKSSDRSRSFPLIVAGGISMVNPEPLREYIDIFGIGDGEVIFPDLVELLSMAKKESLSKDKILEKADKIRGIYIPSLYPVKKGKNFYFPDLKAKIVKKRIIDTIDESFPDENIIVPLANVVFNRLDIEIARGCPQACRFCQAKSYYSPFRVKSVDTVIEFLKNALEKTGFEAFSLSSLSSGDYPFLENLLELIPEIIPTCTSFSVSSLRPSTLSNQLLTTIAGFKKTGITIVPEAGSQRLRNVINKNVSNEDIFKAVELVIENNWRQIKLYFMIGLPTETMDDIKELVTLIEKLDTFIRSKKKKIGIHITFSSFVPKPHTPFQWEKREDLNHTLQKIQTIKQGLKKYRHIELDFHSPQRGIVETILARGDYRVGNLIYQVFKKGEIFSAWDSFFNYPIWKDAIEDINLDGFLSKIDMEEKLPWDFIELNYKKKYLKKENKKSLLAKSTDSCLDRDCRHCSGCMFIMNRNDYKKMRKTKSVDSHSSKDFKLEFNKVRLFFQKSGNFRFFSHLSLIKYIERLIRKSGIKYKCTQGFHPRIKASYLPPIPVYAQGYNEVMEVYLDKNLDQKKILRLLRKVAGDFIFNQAIICNASDSLVKDIHYFEYEINIKDCKKKIQDMKYLLVDSDSVLTSKGRLLLKLDYTHDGQQRFSKIYKVLDPDRGFTFNLTRKGVIFKNDSSN